MKTVLAFLLLCSVAIAATDTLLKSLRPLRLRELSLQNVALKEGERIASVEVEVGGARFSGVHIPPDWGFEAGAPVSGVSVLKGGAAHGVGMLSTTDEFQRFLTLAFYDYDHGAFSIKVKLGLYLFDPKKGESERTIELPSESIVLEEPALPSQPAPVNRRS